MPAALALSEVLAPTEGPDVDRTDPAGSGPWYSFATDDPELGHAFLSRAFVAHRQVLRSPAGAFSLSVALAGVGRARLGRVRCSVGAKTFVPPFDSVLVVRLHSGAYRVEAGGLSAAPKPGQTVILPGDALIGERSDIDLQVTVLPQEDLRQAAAEVTGSAATPRFLSLTPASVEAEQHWLATVDYVERSVLANPLAWNNPLVLQASQRMLAAAALTAFPYATGAAEPQRTERIRSVQIRQAVDFIDAHADQPLTVGEIAAAVGLSPRALQYGFRRELAVSPLGYHRLARLRAAHHELRRADPRSTTVTQVAVRWGFADPSRFAAAYRAEFGGPPSATLRQETGLRSVR